MWKREITFFRYVATFAANPSLSGFWLSARLRENNRGGASSSVTYYVSHCHSSVIGRVGMCPIGHACVMNMKSILKNRTLCVMFWGCAWNEQFHKISSPPQLKNHVCLTGTVVASTNLGHHLCLSCRCHKFQTFMSQQWIKTSRKLPWPQKILALVLLKNLMLWWP